jgi:hypothetical protein
MAEGVEREREFEDLLNERNVYRAALMLASGALKKGDRGRAAERLEARIGRAQVIIDEALRHNAEGA